MNGNNTWDDYDDTNKMRTGRPDQQAVGAKARAENIARQGPGLGNRSRRRAYFRQMDKVRDLQDQSGQQ